MIWKAGDTSYDTSYGHFLWDIETKKAIFERPPPKNLVDNNSERRQVETRWSLLHPVQGAQGQEVGHHRRRPELLVANTRVVVNRQFFPSTDGASGGYSGF